MTTTDDKVGEPKPPADLELEPETGHTRYAYVRDGKAFIRIEDPDAYVCLALQRWLLDFVSWNASRDEYEVARSAITPESTQWVSDPAGDDNSGDDT